MRDENIGNIQTSYDRVADESVARIFGELAHKPFDRQLLDAFASQFVFLVVTDYDSIPKGDFN